MDAQNVVEAASRKPAASPNQAAPELNNPKPPLSRKSPSATRTSPDAREARPNPQDDDGGADANSEAETIVLAGKDDRSPLKARKSIKHEARSDGEDGVTAAVVARKPSTAAKDVRDGAERSSAKTTPARDCGPSVDAAAHKRKRLHGRSEKQRNRADCSSGLSSAPASPPHPTNTSSAHHQIHQQAARRRRFSSAARSAASDTESIRAQSPKPPLVSKEKHRHVDKIVPHKRKAPKAESEDEVERHKARRQRTSSIVDKDSGKPGRESNGGNHSHSHGHSKSSSVKMHHESSATGRVRSVSPAPRAHRRSISTQLPPHSSNGLGHKKKRIPAPLQSTDYHSDDSSPGGSPRMRSSKLRSLTTPAAAESNMSPAKLAPHKKHLDAHGQTFLARACARGEYETAKQRLGERPEDLNVADFAGNTPLQIASINGYEGIVKLLIEAGCALDCVNYDKDTPLLDAVENGHVEVVKLLLDAGVNPRKANVNGEEPLDRVSDETDNADEIRRLLVEAKQRAGERIRTSEEHHSKHTDGRDSHGPESPRQSPATGVSQAASSGRRAGTVRATKTSNHLLYMPMDDKTLRQAAGRGDEETVTRILQVRDTFDDPESMVAAARGGHDMIINLLLALGNANPDPAPVGSMPPEFATPMLAAIGQENIKVVELLLTQGNFDPSRRFKGEAYHEIARRRQGPNWKEEEHMLKDAYDAHRKSQKDSKTKSPASRDHDKDSKRAGRSEIRDESSKLHKRKPSSPSREAKKVMPTKAPASPKEKRRSESLTTHRDDQASPKRGPGRPKKEDKLPTIAVTDRDSPPATVKQQVKPKRTESDIAAVSSEGEAVKPRRKLISGRDLKGEREKQRRSSMVSTTPSLKEPSSPREPRDDVPEKPRPEKLLDRTKQLKRDESRDRLSVSSEGSAKRHRSSATPPHVSSEKESGDAPLKRRRLDVEGKEKRQKTTPVPDDRQSKPTAPRDAMTKGRKDHDDDDRREPLKNKNTDSGPERGRKEPGKSISTEKSIHVKSEDPDVEMRDIDQVFEEPDAQDPKEKEVGKKSQAEAEAEAMEEARRMEEEEDRRLAEEEKRKQQEERERRRRDEEERRRREAEEAEKRRKAAQEEQERRRKEEEQRKRLAEEERKRKAEEEAALKRRREEEERKRLEEEARKRREEEERKRKEQEERKRKEQEERKRKEEEERKRREEAEARRLREEEEERKRLEEEERKRREEEERLRREQLEREAAEQARRKKEEEERKELERLRELERRRAAREAEQQRLFLEQEAIRLGKLPPLLRWLDQCPQPKTAEIAQKFSTMQGVRYDCIRPEATGTSDGREQWLLNTQVALLLGEKDLELSRYTSWERVPVSRIAKIMIWRVEADRYALTSPNFHDIGNQLPDYYGDEDPERLGYRTIEKLRHEAMERFLAMDMFFVKASELMFIVPNITHLRNLRLTMAYRELPEDESLKWESCQKWKIDPDSNRFYGFAPGSKYYVNGVMVHEQTPGFSAVSKTPFPEHRVPRRGLAIVDRDDPEYAQLCKEQGLEHLLEATPSAASPTVNGASSPPTMSSRPTGPYSDGANGDVASAGDHGASSRVNGNGTSHGGRLLASSSPPPTMSPTAAAAEEKQNQPLVNGVNGTPHGAGSSN